MSDTETETSPDGRFEVTYRMSERMNGQWAATPEVRDVGSGAVILALTDERLDGTVMWGERPGRFVLGLRRWPNGLYGLAVHVDADAGTVRLGKDGAVQPLAEAETLIKRHFDARQPPPVPPPPPAPPLSPLRRAFDRAGWVLFAVMVLYGIALALGFV
ncbi:MAG: hypothetical protein NBV68_10010 [Erythrobacter sp.]|uniref:hypothetical protein n=1 Tax=Erythrobacter sp. TaxID=1042 RepID=UPI0025DD87A4|nr:hypothetical protein [Erythrobacter sp.]MCL9999708.1 hypothetical protein [Erythrobacter sp.]